MKWQCTVNGVERTVTIEPRAETGSPAGVESAAAIRVCFDRGHKNEGCHENDRWHDIDAVEVLPGTFSILIGGRAYEASVLTGGEGVTVQCGGQEFSVELSDPRAWRRGGASVIESGGPQKVTAAMPGKVVRVLVAPGEAVAMGQGLLVVEAMKMQNEVRAPKQGTVEKIFVREGQAVGAGEALLIVA